MFVNKVSYCEFESHCSHLNFRYRACFEQGDYRVIHYLHSGNIDCRFTLKRVCDMIIRTKVKCPVHISTHTRAQSFKFYQASLCKWSSVRLWTKWLWVRNQLQSLKGTVMQIEKPLIIDRLRVSKVS